MVSSLRVWLEPWLMPACWSARGIVLRLALLALLLSWGIAVLAGNAATVHASVDAPVEHFSPTIGGFFGPTGRPF